MGYGVLMGLGQGLNAVSTMMVDKQKQDFAAKLEMQKQQNAYENETNLVNLKDANDTRAKLAVPARSELATDGTTGAVTSNVYGPANNLIASTPATAQQIVDKATQDQATANAATTTSLQQKLLQGKVTASDNENSTFSTNNSLENSVKKANISNINSEIQHRNDPPPKGAYQAPEDILMKEFEPQITQLTGTTDKDGNTNGGIGLTPLTVRSLAHTAVVDAMRYPNGQRPDPRVVFQTLLEQTLQGYKNKTAGQSGQTANGN